MEALELVKGRRYRVARPGARLTGWKPVAPYAQQGCAVSLEVGDEVEYIGMRYSGGSDGIDVHAFALRSRETEDSRCCTEFLPRHPDRQTIFDTRPHPEFLEALPEAPES